MNQSPEIEESGLIDKIKQGNPKAFQKLYEIYAPKIFLFSLSYFKNEVEAEELVQEVFTRIWEKRGILDNSKNIKSYIFKIAVNDIYYFIRKKNIKQAYLDYARLNYKVDENYTWHTLIFNEMLENLNRIIAKMPDQQQKIFQLSNEKGLSNDEIAQQLNLSKRTIENHLYRAVSFLKEQFKNDSLFALLFLYINCG